MIKGFIDGVQSVGGRVTGIMRHGSESDRSDLVLWEWSKSFGRSGVLEGVFLQTRADVNRACGHTVFMGDQESCQNCLDEMDDMRNVLEGKWIVIPGCWTGVRREPIPSQKSLGDIPQEIAEKLVRWKWVVRGGDYSVPVSAAATQPGWSANIRAGVPGELPVATVAQRKAVKRFSGPRVEELLERVVQAATEQNRSQEPCWEDMP